MVLRASSGLNGFLGELTFELHPGQAGREENSARQKKQYQQLYQVPLAEEHRSGLPAGRNMGFGQERSLVMPSISSPGYLIIHVVQSLCGVMLMYGLVLPIIHHQGLEMLQGLGLGV